MSIAPISPIGAALRVQLAAALQEALASGITVTPDGQAQRAAQTQAAQAQTPAAEVAETQASAGTNPPTVPAAPQPQDPVRQAVVDSRAATAIRQGAVGPLFADLAEALTSQGGVTPALSAAVRQAMTQVLALQLPTTETVSAQTLRQAVAQSGLFLEARLAAAPAEAAPLPDLKAALLALRQALATLAPSTTPAPPPATPPPALSAPQPTAPPAGAPTAGPMPETPPSLTSEAASQPALATTPNAADATRVVSQPGPLLTTQAAQAGVAPEAVEPATIQPQPALAATPAAQPAPIGADQIEPPPGPAPTTPTPTSPTLALAILRETAEPPSPQTVQQAAQQIPPQALLPAQGVVPSALDITRAVSQSSLLLAAQAAATPEETEPPLDTRLPTPRDAMAAVVRVQAVAPAPPVRDSALEGQAPAPSTLREADDGPAALQRLRQEVDQALARQTLHQLASVPKGSPAEGAAAAWMFEIPIATPQGTAIAQFEIDRDGQRPGAEAGAGGWRARFSIDVEPLGPVHVHMSLRDGRTAVTVYAEREDSLARLREQGDALARDLAGEVVFHPGAPRRPVPASGHFVDRIS